VQWLIPSNDELFSFQKFCTPSVCFVVLLCGFLVNCNPKMKWQNDKQINVNEIV